MTNSTISQFNKSEIRNQKSEIHLIPVTKPFLPPKSEYQAYLDGIWERNWLTNNGPLVNELELSLKEYLGVNHLLYTGNGTIAIQIAIKAMELTFRRSNKK